MVDALSKFSDAQAIAQNAGANEDSTNVLDLDQALGKDFAGNARVPDPFRPGLGVEIVVTTALAGNGAVLTWTVYEHTAAASITSGNLIASLPPITVGAGGVAAGTRYFIPLPVDTIDERYLGLNYAVATANLTAGAVDAALVYGPEKIYP
jgi:hypothetical protein